MVKKKLTIKLLKIKAKEFCEITSTEKIKELFGVTDGKAVGTFIEHRFQSFLEQQFDYERGNSANGIDTPSKEINTDIKVTSIKQPQSSCPFKSAKQKVYGLGYNLLLFVYDKSDRSDKNENCSILRFVSCAFISKDRTGDFQLTKSVLTLLENEGNKEDLIALFEDANLPGDDIGYAELADEIIIKQPIQGYLTISNALQWRLQYGRIVSMASVPGIEKLI